MNNEKKDYIDYLKAFPIIMVVCDHAITYYSRNAPLIEKKVYRLLFDLEKIMFSVVIVFEDKETRYVDGAAAKINAVFSVSAHVSSITARDNDIIIIVEENMDYNSTSRVKDSG